MRRMILLPSLFLFGYLYIHNQLPTHYSYFNPVAPDYDWRDKVEGWQQLEKSDKLTEVLFSEHGQFMYLLGYGSKLMLSTYHFWETQRHAP